MTGSLGATGVLKVGALTTGSDGSMTGEFKGVPSTGQKLNLSANSSLHVEQNFIVTTSFWLWGNSTEDCAAASPLSNAV
jgi:hypothetical protein